MFVEGLMGGCTASDTGGEEPDDPVKK